MYEAKRCVCGVDSASKGSLLLSSSAFPPFLIPSPTSFSQRELARFLFCMSALQTDKHVWQDRESDAWSIRSRHPVSEIQYHPILDAS
jgi:hypothetical protein